MGSTKEAPLRPSISLSSFRNTKEIKMAEITEEQFQALNDQADAEAALKAKLEEENVALGEEIAALEADLAILKAASADADGTKAALAKKKADLEAKIADLEKEFDVEKKMLKHDLEVTRERLQKEIAGLQKELNKESKKVDKAVMDLGLLEFRVATAEQEEITLDQRIQAHKAELKQQQAFIAKFVNKTRDELTAAKETAHTLQRQAIDSSRSWPRPRYMYGGTGNRWRNYNFSVVVECLSWAISRVRGSSIKAEEYIQQEKQKDIFRFSFFHSSPHKQNLLNL